LVIAPGQATELATQLKRLSIDHELRMTMGKNARAMLDASFTRRQAFSRWDAVLTGIRTQVSH